MMITSLRLWVTVGAVLAAVPAFAAENWSQHISRGMAVYTLSDSSHWITLACDPDRVFGDRSNAALSIQFSNHPAPSQIVVLASSGEQASFAVKNGVVSEYLVEPEEWAKMVSILKEGGDYAFVTSKDSMQLQGVASLSDIDC